MKPDHRLASKVEWWKTVKQTDVKDTYSSERNTFYRWACLRINSLCFFCSDKERTKTSELLIYRVWDTSKMWFQCLKFNQDNKPNNSSSATCSSSLHVEKGQTKHEWHCNKSLKAKTPFSPGRTDCITL